MTSDRLRQIQRLLDRALECDTSEQAAFLDNACAGDPTLRLDLDRFLADVLKTTPPSGPLVGNEPTPLRFKLIRKLGSGGFGDVYEAFDAARNAKIALKMLRRVDPLSLLQFKREFRRAAQLIHPNLIRLFELIQDGDRWFFTMELLGGSDVLAYIREQPTATRESALRHTFTQLATGLQALHGVGIVHRDIKPSNVMVTQDGRVVVLDFGIAKELDPQLSQVTSALIGTPAYLAPERFQRGASRETGDWYSAGVMLYQALTGGLPFAGDWLDAIADKQIRDPMPPRLAAPGTSPELSDLCMDLLNRDPDRRPTAADIKARLNAGPVATREPKLVRSTSTTGSNPLVARTLQMETLRKEFDRVLAGHPSAVHVTGPSGIGKTSLVRRFLTEVRDIMPSAAILAGSCYQQESVAFNALDELVDRLTDYLEHVKSPEFLLPASSAFIGRLFPVFNRIAAMSGRLDGAVAVDSVEIRRQAFAGLRVLLGRLCERSAVVIAIDDLQWADRDSASFFDELLRPPDAPPLLLILSYRRQPTGEGDIVERIRHAHTSVGVDRVDIDLGDLSRGDAEILIRQLLERHPQSLSPEEVERIAIEAGGSPFLIERLAQYLLTRMDDDGPIEARTVIAKELDRFTSGQRRLIELVAVAGQPVPLDVALNAAGAQEHAQIDLGHPVAARILQLHRRGSEDLLDVYHDRIRGHVLETLDDETRRAHHRSLIESFQAIRPQDSERLAFHCEHGDRLIEASIYALTAAHQANRALAFDRAVSLYQRALDLRAWDEESQRGIREDLATALANAGRGLESAQTFLAAAAEPGGIDHVRLRIKAADQYLRAGHLSAGQILLRKLLHEVGLSWSDRP